MPQSGEVFRDYEYTNYGNTWRVTDPNATASGAADYLPNPIIDLEVTDLGGALRAEMIFDYWGGHPGTSDRKIRFNNNDWIDLPELEAVTNTSSPNCFTQQVNFVVDVPISDLVSGKNEIQGSSGGQMCNSFGWGQWGMYQVSLRVYYDPTAKTHTSGNIDSISSGESFTDNPNLSVSVPNVTNVSRVNFFAYYDGYDPDGDGIYQDWQVSYHRLNTSGYTMSDHIGTSETLPHQVVWNTDFVPDQEIGSIKLIAHIQDNAGYVYVTNEINNLTLERTNTSVRLYRSADIPQVFWVRNNQEKGAHINIPTGDDLSRAISAELHIKSWNAKQTKTKVMLNDWQAPRFGENHHYSYDRLEVPINELTNGTNSFKASSSDTVHHGSEFMWPGPSLIVRYNTAPRTNSALPASFGFEEISGSTTYDVSENENDGNIVNNASRTDEGRFGKAVEFDGVSGHIDLDALELNGSNITVSMWAYIDSDSPSDGRLFAKANGTQVEEGYFVISLKNRNRILFRMQTESGSKQIFTSPTLTMNAWNHVAVTYDGSEMSIYINGVKKKSSANSGNLYSPKNVPTWIGDNPGPQSRNLKGRVDEVRIYDLAQSEVQIAADMLTSIGSAATDPGPEPEENDYSLNPSDGAFVNPIGDGTLSIVDGKSFELSLPAGVDHDVWSSGNKSARLMYSQTNTDFDLEVKFQSDVTSGYQMQGLIIEEDADTFLRYDILNDGSSVRVFCAYFNNGSATINFNHAIPANSEYYLRLSRVSDSWTMTYSLDGEVYFDSGALNLDLAVSSVGVFAANAIGSNTPAFTSSVSYFSQKETTPSTTPEEPQTTPPGNGSPVTPDPSTPTESENSSLPYWWNANWAYRAPITINPFDTQRNSQTVEIEMDFTSLLAGRGLSAEVDTTTLRIVEIDDQGFIIDETVPFQFNPKATFDSTTNATGTLDVKLVGTTFPTAARNYYVYFSETGSAATALAVNHEVTITDNVMDEGQLSYRINTANSTLFYHKQGAGFSSWLDSNENDWISYNTSAGSAGEYRGIPNMVFPEGHFHPGSTTSTSSITASGPLKVTIHSITNDGKWEVEWNIYAEIAELTVLKADNDYWFLYEGTPGGSLDLTTDFLIRPDGSSITASASFAKDLPGDEWAYFADTIMNRSLFVASHDQNDSIDSYRNIDGNMTVFAFGRDLGTRKFLQGSPKKFTVGLLDSTDFSSVSKSINSHYKNIGISVSDIELTEDATDTAPPTSQPTPPTNVQAIAISDSEINIYWIAPTSEEEVSEYIVLRDGQEVANTTSTSFLDTTLLPGTGYTYQVQTSDTSGNKSTASSAAVETTLVTINTSTQAGEGSISLTPSKEFYSIGESVQAVATPAADNEFSSWSGGLSGSNNPNTFAVSSNQNIAAFFAIEGETPQFYSDDFTDGFNSSVWEFVNPVGDGSMDIGEGSLYLTVPAGSDHDVWTSGNKAPRIMQPAANTDFEAEVKFESQVSQGYQMQGLIVEQDPTNFVRYDVLSNGTTVRIFATSFENGSAKIKLNTTISSADEYYLRISRAENSWALSLSSNGVDWVVQKTFNLTLDVTQIGIFAGNAIGSKSPSFTSKATYFRNTSYPNNPQEPTDQTTGIINTTITGNGQITLSPESTLYHIGEIVQLTATPTSGWSFTGWSGTLSGSNTIENITISGNHNVSAQFDPIANTAPTISSTADISLNEGDAIASIEFAISDSESDASTLIITTTSSNQDFLPSSEFSITGTGTHRSIDINPNSGGGSSTITVTVSDGTLSASSIFLVSIAASTPQSQFRSDDFENGFDSSMWSFVDPIGDGTVDVSEGKLTLSLPEGTEHDVWTSGNNAARIMQPALNEDFEAEVMFDSLLSKEYQMQGFIVEQDASNFIRYDVLSNGSSVRVFATDFSNGSYKIRLNTAISATSEYYLRITRTSDIWSLSLSSNGIDWSVQKIFSLAINVSKIGIFAGNAIGSSSPAFTSTAQYFRNTAEPENPQPPTVPTTGTINTIILGSGQISPNPVDTLFEIGDSTQLTATADPGWTFDGWSGDLSGSNPTESITVTGSHNITAQFTPIANTAPTISSTADISLNNGDAIGAINFAVSDAENDDSTLVVTATSSNQTVIANSGLIVTGTGSQRSLAITPNVDSGSTIITVTVSDATLSASTSFQTTITTPPAQAQFYSDDFEDGFNDSIWTFVNPIGDASMNVSGGNLTLSMPAGSEHDVWTSGNHAPRIMQPAADEDFEAEVKFVSQLIKGYQMQGLIIQQNETNFLRYDVLSNGSAVRVFATSFIDGSAKIRLNTVVSSANEYTLRATRNGNNWTLSLSTNGSNFTVQESFDFDINVSEIGIFAGNAIGSKSPAFTAKAAYFLNTNSPLNPGAQEEPTTGAIDTAVTGNGQISLNPESSAYEFGNIVQLTASPAANWTFTGWSGDLSGTNSTENLTVSADHSITAQFEPVANTAPSITSTTNISLNEGDYISPVSFTSSDSESDDSTLIVTASSSNQALISDNNLTITGTGPERSLYIAPNTGGGTSTITVTVSDGLLSESTSFLISITASPIQLEFLSDEFRNGIDDTRWQFVDPIGDGTISTESGRLTIHVPAGADHDVWTSGNKAPRLMQKFENGDFEIEAKFDSLVTEKYQMQGFIIEQDSSNYIRYDLMSDGSKSRLFAASFINGSAKVRVNKVIAINGSSYLKITRVGNNWTMKYSTDGENFVSGTDFNLALNITSAGVFAANATGSNSPEFTASIDYVSNSTSPVDPNHRSLVTSLSGLGSVSKNPEQPSYALGQNVELTAIPSLDWIFMGWTGDLATTTNSITATMNGDFETLALFVPTDEEDSFVLNASDTILLSQNATTSISGNLIIWEQIDTITYSINHLPQGILKMGPEENHELENPGDFEFDINAVELIVGDNLVEIIATHFDGSTFTKFIIATVE